MSSFQWRLLVVREGFLVTVRLVRRGNDDLPEGRTPPACFQNRPGTAHIRFKGRDWVAVRDADNSLRREMDDRLDLVLAKGAFDQCLVANVSLNCPDALRQPGADEFRLRDRVA